MRWISLLLVAFLVACPRKSDPDKIEAVHESTSSSHATPPPADDLDASIDLAISMLEKKSYRVFLERFIAPEDRPKLLKDGGIDAILPEFSKYKADGVLEMLRSIRGTKPTTKGNEAVFEAKDKDIRWVLEDGKWYIRN
jgi:hypothetical protein